MISLARVKELLSDETISDEEVERIRCGFDALVSDIIFPSWLEKRNENKQRGGNENKQRDDDSDYK